MSFPASLSYRNLTGALGFNITGPNNSNFGYSVSLGGDINGDGKDDLMVGAPCGGCSTPAAYVIFGASSFKASLSYSSLNGTNGFSMTGASRSYFGWSVSLGGDINGDGKDDLVVGAYAAGAAYVVFGTSSFGASLSTSSLNGVNGFSIIGPSGSQFGWSVSIGGDINGDGKDDLVVGAFAYNSFAGAAYVIFGASSFGASLSISSLNGMNGFSITGQSGSSFGGFVSLGGDVNGDGKDDLVVGADAYNSGAGAAYVIFGASSFSASLSYSALNGANGFSITGPSSSEFGFSVSLGGDINGDGKYDLVVGADYHNTGGNGAAYVIFGASSFSASLSYSSLNGTNGFSIIGPSGSWFGCSVSLGGDINGDGRNDLVVGAYNYNSNAGVAYVIFGASYFGASLTYSALNGTNGFVITGPSGSGFGWSVSLGADLTERDHNNGDLNGDGIADLIVGTVGTDGNNAAASFNMAYVLFGQNCTTGCFMPASQPVPILVPHPSPTPQSTPALMPAFIPDLSSSPVPTPAYMPHIIPSPMSEPAPLTPQPASAPSSGSIAMIIGIVAGVAAIGAVGGLIVYSKIKHLWCFADRPEPSELMPGEALPIIGNYE